MPPHHQTPIQLDTRTLVFEFTRDFILGLLLVFFFVLAQVLQAGFELAYYSALALLLDLGLAIAAVSLSCKILPALNTSLNKFIRPEIYYLEKILKTLNHEHNPNLPISLLFAKISEILTLNLPELQFSILDGSQAQFAEIDNFKWLVGSNTYFDTRDNNLNIEISQKLLTHKIAFVQRIDDKYIFVLFSRDNLQLYAASDINILKQTLNRLSEIVAQMNIVNSINEFNVTLKKKISEATSELQQAYDKLKLEDEGKNDILNIISHQLLTPISIIRGEIEELNDTDNAETRSKIIETLAFQSQRAYTIIDQILRVSRIIQKGNNIPINKTPVDIVALINQISKTFSERISSKNLSFNFNKPADINELILNLDETMISEVISNLIDNAINYTPAGSINIELENHPHFIILNISDSGIGIKPEDIPTVFNKFIRLQNAKNIRPDGTGIGLYFIKLIIDAHHGQISVSSPGEDKGSKFSIKLFKD